ncbi:MAG: BamA/TamA family outer membrane protein [Microcystaceae cyanobacterium]
MPTFDNLPLITAESDSDIPKITQTTTEEEESSEDESEETSDNETETPTDSIPTTPPDTETVEQETPAEEPRVLVAEVVVTGADLQLERLVYNTIATKPGRTATRSQLQNDVNAIYATGFFANVKVVPEDTPLGIRITFSVEPNPILENVVIETVPETEKERVLPEEIIKDNFDEQYGKILNLRDLQESIQAINEWYSSNGYDLAQVIGSPQISEDGVVTLIISEGVIEDIQVRFFDAEDEALDGGRTRDFIVTREMRLKPGDVFNRNTAQQDLQRVFGLGLFEDVRLAFSPGEDPSEVIVNVDVVEGRTGSVAAGAGISSTSGLFGTLSYQEQNLGGNNQTVATELQVGERDLLFDVSFTDPWIATDPFRTSYTANIFRRRTISLVFDGDNSTIRTLNGFDSPRVVRTGTGVTFVRPLAEDVFTRPDWRLTAGFNYQRVQVKNADGDNSPFSAPLNGFPSQPLSFDSSGNDDLFTFNIGAAQDTRNNPLQPTRGSVLRLGMEQTVPVGSGSILFNRVRGSYSFYVPLDFIDFGFIEEGQPKPQALAFNFQAGTVLGDLPPYEAFVIGGSNSVRGYAEGEVGSGRSYFQATAEYRFPIIAIIGGALFVDYGTVLGSDGAVPGVPSRVRGLPGNGTGYGLGVRIQSPVGPIRIDYGFRDGGSRLHFGIGERF